MVSSAGCPEPSKCWTFERSRPISAPKSFRGSCSCTLDDPARREEDVDEGAKVLLALSPGIADVQAERDVDAATDDDGGGSFCSSAGSCSSVDRGRTRACRPRIGSDRDMLRRKRGKVQERKPRASRREVGRFANRSLSLQRIGSCLFYSSGLEEGSLLLANGDVNSLIHALVNWQLEIVVSVHGAVVDRDQR